MQMYSSKHGMVEVLQETACLMQVRDDASREFWVRREALKIVKVRLPRPADRIPDLDSRMSWSDLVSSIAPDSYRLDVHTKHDVLEQVEYEYLTWSYELLPESAVRIYENRPTGREWRLVFPCPQSGGLPFPVEIMGTTGQRPTKNPRGLLLSGRIYVYFTELVEQFVRAGLRATA